MLVFRHLTLLYINFPPLFMNRLVVGGYCKSKNQYVPLELYGIVAKYLGIMYYIPEDNWNAELSSPDASIEKTIFKNGWYQKNEKITAYGNRVVKIGEICTWKLCIVRKDKEDPEIYGPDMNPPNTCVGIIKNIVPVMKKFRNSDCWHRFGYQMESLDLDYFTEEEDRFFGITERETSICCTAFLQDVGDTVYITLNLRDFTLSFQGTSKNNWGGPDPEPLVVFKNIEKAEYRLVLTMDTIYVNTSRKLIIKLN